jgi:hypothetical protein
MPAQLVCHLPPSESTPTVSLPFHSIKQQTLPSFTNAIPNAFIHELLYPVSQPRKTGNNNTKTMANYTPDLPSLEEMMKKAKPKRSSVTPVQLAPKPARREKLRTFEPQRGVDALQFPGLLFPVKLVCGDLVSCFVVLSNNDANAFYVTCLPIINKTN